MIAKPAVLSVKITVPKVAPTPVALIDLIVAVAVAAAAGVSCRKEARDEQTQNCVQEKSHARASSFLCTSARG